MLYFFPERNYMADTQQRITGNFEKLGEKMIELVEVRKMSLRATKAGNYLLVARLTVQAAALNKEIRRLESTLPPP